MTRFRLSNLSHFSEVWKFISTKVIPKSCMYCCWWHHVDDIFLIVMKVTHFEFISYINSGDIVILATRKQFVCYGMTILVTYPTWRGQIQGDSDVGDIFMLVTLRWWLISDVGGRNIMFFRYVGDFLNVLNRSATTWIDHQHFKLVTNTFGLQHPSPTSM